MEKRNIVEPGRTPAAGTKLADALDKVAEAAEFNEFEKPAAPAVKPQEHTDEKKD